MYCPRKCLSDESSKVYGSMMYSGSSSVCKAAIHAGVIDNSQGGICYVGVEKP